MLGSSDEIISGLRKINQMGRNVRMINVYKGFPVAYDARILSIGIDAVTFKVHRYQALCLWLENQTFIQSDEFPEIVRALAITVDLETEIAALSNFEYVSGAPGKREDARVLLRSAIDVFLTIGNKKLRAELRDLSTKGVAVFIHAAYYDPELLQVNEPLQITFQLPGGPNHQPRDIELHGLIRSVTRDQVNRYRIGIQIVQADQEDPLVMGYVVQRQSEVMQEIQMLHESILSLSSGEEDSLEDLPD